MEFKHRHPLDRLPLEEVLWRLDIPLAATGALDWTSGVMILDADSATFSRVSEEGAQDEDEKDLVRTVTHELVHFYQVLLTGYLHRHVAGLSLLLNMCIGEARAKADVKGFADLVRLMDRLPDLVQPENLRLVAAMHAELERTDSQGLSVMHLVEGCASFVEFLDYYECNAPGYLEILSRHRVGPRYRAAYDLAVERLGAHTAFSVFQLLVFLALCSSHPVMSYRLLLDEVAERVPRWPTEEIQLDLGSLTWRCCGYTYFGDTVTDDEADAAGSPFTEALQRVQEWFATTGVSVGDVFRQLEHHLPDLAAIASPPILLNPMETGGTPVVGGVPRGEGLEGNLPGILRAVAYRRIVEWAEQTGQGAAGVMVEAEERAANLEAVREGVVDGLYNLGAYAAFDQDDRIAVVWWKLAALRGDVLSLRAVALASRAMGDTQAARQWLELTEQGPAEALEGARRILDPTSLLRMAQAVEAADPDAAEECLRAAADQGSVQAAYRFGCLVVDRDPVLGFYYLVLAAGAPPVYSESRLADERIRSLRRAWGRRRSRQYRRQVWRKLKDAVAD